MSISCADLQEETKKIYERNGWETNSTLLTVAMGEELGELWCFSTDSGLNLLSFDSIPRPVGRRRSGPKKF
ncbi:MAG: hypothetical protein U9M98_02350 [Patescibacteria group bacterium]|nr:hypothetical protein [Patescibacteria group bacterium]